MLVPIRVLDERTINKIAAGEVVERPASVVKELMENALDAGARRVEVRLADDNISVIDDGCGMSAGDIMLAVERHATSKITAVEDLGRLGTYGFRGEALPSIAAVSELTIRSRQPGDAVGNYLVMRAGDILEQGEAAMPAGTAVEVRRLFHNTPVRAKFLKSERTERARMVQAVERLALGRPDVACRCTLDSRLVLATSGSGDHLETLLALSGVELARQVRQSAMQEGGHGLVALIGSPATARADRRQQGVWINSRPVYARGVLEAAMAAYPLGLSPARRFPLLYLFLSLPPAEVDANVHPAKAEVRLAAESTVFSLVVRGLRQAATEAPDCGPVPQARPGIRAPEGGQVGRGGLPQSHGPVAREGDAAGASSWPAGPSYLPGGGDTPLHEPGPPGYLLPAMLTELRPLGQSGRRWLICDGPGGVFMVDQHAAHERVLYEQLEPRTAAAATEAVPAQPLAVPFSTELDSGDYLAWETVTADLAAAGLVTEPFGGRSVLIRSVPARLLQAGFDPARFLRDVLAAVDGEQTNHSALAPHLRIRRAVASCAAAVKANQHLGADELEALLRELAACREPLRCPHGRPTVVRIGHEELARRFGRS